MTDQDDWIKAREKKAILLRRIHDGASAFYVPVAMVAVDPRVHETKLYTKQ